MANIGTFKKAGEGYTGSIRTLILKTPAMLEAIPSKTNDKAPDFRLTAEGCEIGAAWKKTSKEGKEYLSVTIDDPSLPQPINAALFKSSDSEDHFLTWQRQ